MDLEEGARLWAHGLVLTFVLVLATTVLTALGLTLSFDVLGVAPASFSALFFVLFAFVLLPLVYGFVSRKVSDVLHEDVSWSSLDSASDWVMLWIQGLVYAVLMIVISLVFSFVGFSLSLTVLLSAFTSVTAMVFAILSIVVLPIVYGFTSKGLTELLT